jgi:hypothetical protein
MAETSKTLVDRLRAPVASKHAGLMDEAANEIERLRTALERIAHAKSSVLNAEQFARAESMLQRWAADALNKAPPDEWMSELAEKVSKLTD